MKKIIGILSLLWFAGLNAQNGGGDYNSAFKAGEWFQFRVHYGILNASFATLEVKDSYVKETPVYHVVGKGRTTGIARLFFKVDDTYETYIDKQDNRPYKFIRNINEGGHKKDIEINFDYGKKTALY